MNTRKRKSPTPAEVAAQIEALRVIKPKVLRRSGFGDDHHAAIDAQIEVLERRLTFEQIADRSIYEDDPDGDGDWTQNVSDAARDARNWLDGQLTDQTDLVESWQELVR